VLDLNLLPEPQVLIKTKCMQKHRKKTWRLPRSASISLWIVRTSRSAITTSSSEWTIHYVTTASQTCIPHPSIFLLSSFKHLHPLILSKLIPKLKDEFYLILNYKNPEKLLSGKSLKFPKITAGNFRDGGFHGIPSGPVLPHVLSA